MLYLALQMAFLLVISALIGVVVGWWVNRFKQKPVVEFDDTGRDEDLYALKNRLDKCFDDNAALRRDLKNKETQVASSDSQSENGDEKSHGALKVELQALMDDLQLRDDTITALEKELNMVGNKT